MSDPFLGQIIQGGWNFAPRGYHSCDGSILSIAQNSALFSLLGTSFGGNGQTTFAIPDLRGRVMINTGQAPGLSPYSLGQVGGGENTSLTIQNMPQHTHTFSVATVKASAQVAPANGVLGHSIDGAPSPAAVPEIYCPAGTPTPTPLAGIGPAGGSLPFSNLQPYLAITIVIALEGIFPSRN